MSTKAKIITAAMGLICLAITLIFPSDATILSIAPVIVTFSAWIFISNNKNIRIVEGIFMGFALITIAACFVLGMSYNYDNGCRILTLKSGALFFNNLEYIPIALLLFVAATTLAIGEIVTNYRTNLQNEKMTINFTYNELVKQAIVVIK